MVPLVQALVVVVGAFRSRITLQLEVLVLRQQLNAYRRSIRRPRVRPSDRIFWSWLARHWARWREVVVFVQPATVLAWQRFRDHGARLSWKEVGRPAISEEVRELIREMSAANPGEDPDASWADYGSWESRWRNRRWKSIASARHDRPRHLGGPS